MLLGLGTQVIGSWLVMLKGPVQLPPLLPLTLPPAPRTVKYADAYLDPSATLTAETVSVLAVFKIGAG
jgi:hypothetical protein